MTAFAAARPSGIRVARSPAEQQIGLALAYLGLVALTCAMTVAGLGSVARPFYIFSGIGFAAFTIGRSPWLYVTATLWFWLVTAFVRRFIEWRTGFNPTDIILATPNLLMMFMLRDVLTTPGLLTRPDARPALAATVAVGYGICVSFFCGDVIPGAVAAADWLAPSLYFFFILANSEKIGLVEPHLRQFLLLSMIVTISYGLYQYFYMPEWDALWMIGANTVSIGLPLPMESRAFGTTNNPTFLAIWMAACVLLGPHFRSKALAVMVPFAIFVLLITFVRAVYISLALALAVAAVLGRGGAALKSLLAAGMVLMTVWVGMEMVNPVVADRVITRLESLQKLEADGSAQDRQILYQETPELINGHPIGLGIGALGRGAVAGNNGLVSVDSALLSIYLALGWRAGTVYIAGLILLVVRAMAAAWRQRFPLAVMFACAALASLALFPFANISNFDA
ncbi:MAG: hypothetical protein JO122_19685, partial [Acetobacteraceae bacterium]|nr:hypothetical protein [Acetobacteraceae bacterium]